jgi:hypothetical protein
MTNKGKANSGETRYQLLIHILAEKWRFEAPQTELSKPIASTENNASTVRLNVSQQGVGVCAINSPIIYKAALSPTGGGEALAAESEVCRGTFAFFMLILPCSDDATS